MVAAERLHGLRALLLLLLLLLLYSINTEGQPGQPGSLNIELVINTNAYSNTLKLDRMG